MDLLSTIMRDVERVASPYVEIAEGFDCHESMAWMHASFRLPFIAVALYLAFVAVGPLIFGKGLPRAVTRPLFFFWNLFLSLFSVWGFWACFSFILREYSNVKGTPDVFIKQLVCSDDMIMRDDGACYGVAGFAGYAFTLSKFFELGDTVFLVLMGKKVEFLQWWHHATVLLYCWFAWGHSTPSALTFGTMNYFVHMQMYFYFAVSQYSTILRPIRSLITLLQLAQMVVGVSITALSYYYSNHTGGCSPTYDDTYFITCGVMYSSYLILFLNLFLQSYVLKTRKKSKTE